MIKWLKNVLDRVLCLERSVLTLCALVIVANVISVSPLIPVYLGRLGLSLTDLGVVLAFTGYVSTLCRIFFGWLADIVGPRTLIALGYAVAGIAYLLFALFSSLPYLLIPATLLGLAPTTNAVRTRVEGVRR